MHPLRQIPIHRALHRPSTIMGAERELVLLTGLIAFMLIVVALSVMSAVLGIVLWIAGVAVLASGKPSLWPAIIIFLLTLCVTLLALPQGD